MPLLIVDYRQLELRISATVWPDPKWIAAQQSGDLHRKVAIEVLHKPDPTEEDRVKAKNVNFGIIYGSEGYHVATQAKLSLAEVQRFIEQMKLTYPKLFALMKESRDQVRRLGYVETLTGWRRRFHFDGSPTTPERMLKQYDRAKLREATNTLVQGPAAELTLDAMVELDRRGICKYIPFGVRTSARVPLIVGTVHDSIIVDCPSELLEVTKAGIKEVCENLPTMEWYGFQLQVPLEVEFKVGPNWGDAV